MLRDYLPILIQLAIVLGLAWAILLLSVFLGKSAKRNATKDSAYECGMPPAQKQQARFSVKFYLVAMLFVIFDVEVVFLYPWAVAAREQLDSPQAALFLSSMLSFVGILFIAYLYALKKGALEWKKD